jgi:capsular polysaccharide biosynthesis protein
MFRLITYRLLESYFRHRWLYLLPIVMMSVLAILSFFMAKPKYIARGAIFIQKQPLLAQLTSVKGTDFTWQTPAAVTAGELKELYQTDSFMRAVIKDTDLEANMSGGTIAVNKTINDARKAIWVSPIGDNQILIGAAYEQPEITLQLVNGIIGTFLQWKINGDRADSQVAHTFFASLISQYQADVNTARQTLYNYLNAHPAPLKGERPPVEQLEISRLQADLDMVQTRYASAIDKDENAQLAAAQAQDNVVQSFVVIDSPTLPEKPNVSLKQVLLQKAIFIAVGIFISLIAIAGGALLDRSFRFPIDVTHGINLPVLAIVPSKTAPDLLDESVVVLNTGHKGVKRNRRSKSVVVYNELSTDNSLESQSSQPLQLKIDENEITSVKSNR